MKLSELARSATREITSHKVRSALTCFSLAIGVAAILYTSSQVQGMKKRYQEVMDLSGPGRIRIEGKRGYTSKGLSKGLQWEDAQAIRKAWPELYMVYPKARRGRVPFHFEEFHYDNVIAMGTTEEWRKRDWVYDLEGRFLRAADVKDSARVCVLIKPKGWFEKPYWAKYWTKTKFQDLLSHNELLGKQVEMHGHLFTVVGIIEEPYKDKDPRWMREWGGQGTAIVPITTYNKLLGRSRPRLRSIQVDTGNADNAGKYIRLINQLMKARHRGEEDFEIKDFRELIGGAMKRLKEFTTAILVIGVVAVLAGGIGIMNVTLATIFSRIREIGIRRSLGATRSDIVWQFVTEAVTLGLIGGVAGCGLGIAAVKYLAPDADRMIPLGAQHFAGALLVAIGTGFFFSIFPAYQASRFDPVESLRYE